MAWTNLKAAVAAVIRTNGNQEITGALLQSTLNSIIDQVGANSTFKGVATPATTPGTPDGPLFYIAYEKGIYANFNAINIAEEDGLVIILYSSNWDKINLPLALKDELNDRVLKATLINAGAGLTGGGTLEQDRTLDIVSANEGITVNADNIQLNTQDALDGTSTTKPLSAKQGAELNNRINMYGTAGGTAQAITLAVSASITLSAGMRFTFKPIANNTANSPTININNLGAKTILRGINAAASAALIANDIVQNIDAILEYDGTNFRLLNPQTGGIVQSTGTDTDKVMSQKAVTEAIANSLWYGIEFDTAVSSPTCTRIGNSDLHKTLPIQSRMRGCLLDDNGDVVEYLNPTDWTGNVRDGSRGQVMVELPLHYVKFETEGTKRRVCMSTLPLPGYKQVKLQYVSAYEATVDRTNTKLASVLNLTAQFRGGDNNTQYDGTYRTFIGRAATVLGRQTFRSYARKRKADSTEWNCMTYGIQKELYWLFAVEYATLNSQAAFNAEKTYDGYRQGGLGNGVSNASDWSNFNGLYPFVPIGHTDSLGNQSGQVLYTVSNGNSGQPISQNVYVNRYRGVENPFAHIWQWTDGINIRISPTAENGGDNLSKVCVCEDPSKFNDSNYAGYHHVGNGARNSGYVKSFIFGEEGDIMPDAVGGSSSTYACDYHSTSIPTTETLRGVLFGGHAYYGSACGFASAYSDNAPSAAAATVGSRLCFIPV